MELDAVGDLDDGRIGHVTDPQRRLAEMVGGRPVGGPRVAGVLTQAGHGLPGSRSGFLRAAGPVSYWTPGQRAERGRPGSRALYAKLDVRDGS